MNQPKTWFVTGTSKGIGFMLVKELLQAGHNVIATTRQPDTLLDALGSLEEVTDEEFRQSMDINLFGAINVIRAVIPPMRNQNSGHVINISSNAGYVGYGNAGAYNAAKFALIGVSEALALETQPFGIKVTVVAPGQFRTNFMDKGSMQFAKNRIAAYELDKAEQLWNDFSGQQAGDPLKLVTILMELVNHPAPPLHLLLGPDTYELIQTHRQREKEEFDAWKTVSLSTNFD